MFFWLCTSSPQRPLCTRLAILISKTKIDMDPTPKHSTTSSNQNVQRGRLPAEGGLGIQGRVGVVVDALLLVHQGEAWGGVHHPAQAPCAEAAHHEVKLLLVHHGLAVVEIHRRKANALGRIIVVLALKLQSPVVGSVGCHANVHHGVGDVGQVGIEK